MNKLLSRKFIVAMTALLCLTAICAVGRIDGGQFLTGVGLVVGMFTAANLKEKQDALAASAKKKEITS